MGGNCNCSDNIGNTVAVQYISSKVTETAGICHLFMALQNDYSEGKMFKYSNIKRKRYRFMDLQRTLGLSFESSFGFILEPVYIASMDTEAQQNNIDFISDIVNDMTERYENITIKRSYICSSVELDNELRDTVIHNARTLRELPLVQRIELCIKYGYEFIKPVYDFALGRSKQILTQSYQEQRKEYAPIFFDCLNYTYFSNENEKGNYSIRFIGYRSNCIHGKYKGALFQYG